MSPSPGGLHTTSKPLSRNDIVAGMSSRVVLITGASSGIGLACARHLHDRGFRVYGTSRNRHDSGFPWMMLQMEVTDDASARQSVQTVIEREGRIDVLVNNAGIAIAGPLESMSVEEAKRQIDVNVIGAFRVCRAALPYMRTQRSGYLVNIGSIGGLIGIPFQALYSASKFALEGMTESLRTEVRPFGIRVVLIEPGDTKTPITGNRMVTADLATREAYSCFPAALKRMAEDEQSGPGPEGVARLLYKVVSTANPRLRYTVGPQVQRVAAWLKRLLPNALLEHGMRWYYGIGL
jgi:NAD(P)-dependent dehydrogenase (short-subunit alcohol dehydrogenase family)